MVILSSINPPEAVWEDQFAYTPTDQNVRYTLGGKPIIETAVRKSGRPITLRCQWVSLADLRKLESLCDQPKTVMDLVLTDGQSFAAAFRHTDIHRLMLRQLLSGILMTIAIISTQR